MIARIPDFEVIPLHHRVKQIGCSVSAQLAMAIERWEAVGDLSARKSAPTTSGGAVFVAVGRVGSSYIIGSNAGTSLRTDDQAESLPPREELVIRSA